MWTQWKLYENGSFPPKPINISRINRQHPKPPQPSHPKSQTPGDGPSSYGPGIGGIISATWPRTLATYSNREVGVNALEVNGVSFNSFRNSARSSRSFTRKSADR